MAVFGSEIPIRKVSTGKKRWLLDLRSVGGRREFYLTRDETESIRDAKLREVREHGTAALALTTEDRLAFTLARDRLAKIGLTISDAVAFAEKHHAAVEPIQFSAAIEQIVKVKRNANKDEEYVEKLDSHLRSLMLTTSDKPLAQVTREEIERWLFGNGWSPATIRNLRIDVRTFFNFAAGRRWIVTNPAEHLEQVQLNEAPPGILKLEEVEALLRSALATRRHFLPHVVLALLCGLRPDEVVALGPEHVQIDRRHVEVPAAVAKSRKRRIVDLSENAAAWLEAGPEIEPIGRARYARQMIKLRSDAAKILKRAMPWPKNCLRHSYASYHLAMHGSAEKTALQMGHRSTDMLFRHYRELVTREQAELFWKILPSQAHGCPTPSANVPAQ